MTTREFQLWRVGGCVRDYYLGMPWKDLDYAVVAPSYEAMVDHLKARGVEIVKELPHFVTVRGFYRERCVDFTLCRKETMYSDGRHPDTVTVGTLAEDLARRDFTMNAIAVSESGLVVDPWNGRQAITDRVIACVGDASDRFDEDPLRMLRALRFAVTKEMWLHRDVRLAMQQPAIVVRMHVLPKERIREELGRMFKHDTYRALGMLWRFPLVCEQVLDREDLWLKPTSEQR